MAQGQVLSSSPPKAMAMIKPAAVIVGPVSVSPPRTAAGLPELGETAPRATKVL